MKCPLCQGKTRVLETRKADNFIKRRRECKECGYRFRTIETIKEEKKS